MSNTPESKSESQASLSLSTSIDVFLRRIEGNDVFFPISPNSMIICKLLESNTLTKKQLKICKDGGWPVSIKMEDYNLDD